MKTQRTKYLKNKKNKQRGQIIHEEDLIKKEKREKNLYRVRVI
jgi:hypothetical protein